MLDLVSRSTSFARVDDPAAWTSAEVGGKAGLLRQLTPEELAAADRFFEEMSDRQAESITADELTDPALVALAAEVRHAIMAGRGAIVLSGIDVEACGLEGFKRLYWAIGTHIGHGVEQSHRRDRIGFVQKEENNPTGRGYLMDVELRPHTDFHEVLSLSCVRASATGGESGLVSSLGIHNIILDERPDLLEPLYEGFYHESAGGVVSDAKVPIFATVDGKTSCYYHPLFMHRAAKLMGVDLPAPLAEAMAYMGEVSQRSDVRAFFMLAPGEMMFWHNFTQLHSREGFNDTPDHKRLLLRLWINVENGRPMPAVFHSRAKYMDEAHGAGTTAINYASEPDLATR